jgi:cysteine synthase A
MMSRTYDSILETIGNTPVVRLSRLHDGAASLYAKLEAFNPGGSVKDRLAAAIIEEAERSGALKPGQTVIEATSGNTGIGLAMVCAQRGYPLVVTMAENFSIERRKLLRFLGAKVVLTPASEKGSGMLAKAVELAQVVARRPPIAPTWTATASAPSYADAFQAEASSSLFPAPSTTRAVSRPLV